VNRRHEIGGPRFSGRQLNADPLGGGESTERMLGKLLLLLGSVVFILVSLAVPFLYQNRYDERNLKVQAQAQLGWTREQVEHLAGEPSYVTDGTRWVDPAYARSGSELIPGCVTEYWYRSWVIFIPSRYSYCFNSDGHLIHKFHWFSW
jgi:hypothetical protein